jgi:hypothetical protein
MATNQLAYSAFHLYQGRLGNISFPVFMEQYWDKGLSKNFQMRQDKLFSNPYPEASTPAEKLRNYYESQVNVAVSNISKLLQNRTAAKRDSIMRNDEVISANVNLACENDTRYGSAVNVLTSIGVQTPLIFQQDMALQICQRIGREWPDFHRKSIASYDSEKFIRHFRKHLVAASLPETRLVSGTTVREQSHEASLDIMESTASKVSGVIHVSDDGKPLASLRTDQKGPFHQAVDNALAFQKFVAPGLVSLSKPPGLVSVSGESPVDTECAEPVGRGESTFSDQSPGLIPLASLVQQEGLVGNHLSGRVGKANYDRWMNNAKHYEHLKARNTDGNYFLHFGPGEKLFLHRNGKDVLVDANHPTKKGYFYVHDLPGPRETPRQKGELHSGTGKFVRNLNSEELEPVFGHHRHEIYWNDTTNEASVLGEALAVARESAPGLLPLADVASDAAEVDGPFHDWVKKHKDKKEQKKQEKTDKERREREAREEAHRTKSEVAATAGPLSWLDDEGEKLRQAHEKRHTERYDEHEARRAARAERRRNRHTSGLVKGEQLDIGNHESTDDSGSSADLRGSGSPFASTSSSVSNSASNSEDETEGRPAKEYRLPLQTLFGAAPGLIAPQDIGQKPAHSLQRLTADHPLAQKLLQTQRVQSPVAAAPTVETATAYLKKYLAAEGAKFTDKTLVYLAPTDDRLNPVKFAIEQHENPNKVTQFAALHLFHDISPNQAVQGRSFSPVAAFGQTISISPAKVIKYSTGETPMLAEPTFYYDKEHTVFVRIVPQGSIIRPQQ